MGEHCETLLPFSHHPTTPAPRPAAHRLPSPSPAFSIARLSHPPSLLFGFRPLRVDVPTWALTGWSAQGSDSTVCGGEDKRYDLRAALFLTVDNTRRAFAVPLVLFFAGRCASSPSFPFLPSSFRASSADADTLTRTRPHPPAPAPTTTRSHAMPSPSRSPSRSPSGFLSYPTSPPSSSSHFAAPLPSSSTPPASAPALPSPAPPQPPAPAPTPTPAPTDAPFCSAL
ncbi:hypothetical protein B0H15DRAFT_944257 [Mycena belliarum]|uniref:Uncharacterized protein n=1 Tax=Mycena belliarum TaxID=1033014 RepID=A0AAD6UH31_9AGAR|nr:hypothetical protein B0H15DRAFT_944257 [Mycena belliae]